MMKTYKYILIIFLALTMSTACDDFAELDLEPQDLISGNLVFEDQSLAEANLAQIYESTLFMYNDYQGGVVNMVLDEGMGAVCRGFAYWQAPSWFPITVINADGIGPLDYWPYNNIREANTFIQGMSNSEFDPSYKSQRVAEARYLRAHMYFQMVKRYGGVPIITEPQSADAPLEELNVARASEQATYDFIASEMDAIVDELPENPETGRVNKFAALALKSRAMLYAGSIGQFGEVQSAGSGENQLQLGIPDASMYWQASYDASMELIGSGQFALYNEIPDDPAENFEQLFIDESNNPEKIFVEVFDQTLNKGHSWSRLSVPFEFRAEWGSNYCPYLNIIEEFEYADGTPGTISRDAINSDQLFDIDEVFRNRDPRFLATFFFPESEFQGGVARFHRRTIFNGDTVTSGTVGDGWPAAAPRRNYVNTGFLTRKMVDESQIGPVAESCDEDFIIFRYGEVILNAAEAAFYLGREGEALELLNQIRARAGMPLRTSVTEEDLRHERQVELVFEDHRYWDLRRWRIAHEFLDGLSGKGLEYTYHYEEDKYDFHLKNAEAGVRTFQERHYYLPLGVSRIADNPNLIENPGY